MLVLTRKRTEMIKIGDNISVKVIQTGRGSVKLGIEAPAEVRVLRGELCRHQPEVAPHSNAVAESEDVGHAEPLTAERFLQDFDAAPLGDQFPTTLLDFVRQHVAVATR